MTNFPLLLKDLAKEVREKGTDLGLGEAFAEACLKGAEALEREEGCKNQVAQSFLCSACGCYCEYNDEYPVEYNYCPNCGRRVEK